ncbi:hypothetical protein PROPHIGD54-2_10 [Mycobacterium phage prophiGD54-2]|nr:hypothetical protein PROPHIGD54-2_10 [Mycobacterium phage prophiGD54-2]
MSDAQRLISEVISKAWAKAQDDAYLHGAWNSSPTIDPDEWSAEIDKALGGLTPQTRPANLRCGCGNEADLSWCDEECGRFHPTEFEHGWVSGWTQSE